MSLVSSSDSMFGPILPIEPGCYLQHCATGAVRGPVVYLDSNAAVFADGSYWLVAHCDVVPPPKEV